MKQADVPSRPEGEELGTNPWSASAHWRLTTSWRFESFPNSIAGFINGERPHLPGAAARFLYALPYTGAFAVLIPPVLANFFYPKQARFNCQKLSIEDIKVNILHAFVADNRQRVKNLVDNSTLYS
jgi:hypothetical protein